VELLVAVLFTSILMMGMAKVFQASLGTFAAASENITSGRKNRLAADLLYDDLNQANMLASALLYYPPTTTTNPPFIVNPNVGFDPTTVTDIPAANAKADQLIFYYDDVLPFEATLGTTLTNTSQQVASSGQAGDNSAFTITLRDANQAASAASAFSTFGLSVLLRSSGYTYKLASASQHGSGASLDATLDSSSGYSGGAVSGSTFLTGAPAGTGVTLIRPGRYVRYSIKPQSLDPSTTVQTPCLIREEVTYSAVSGSATPFATPDDTAVVAENVVGFKVMLSGDGGKTWAGSQGTETQWSDLTGPASGGASPTLNWQFQSGSTPTRPNMNSTSSSPFWFREIPVLVRVDVTTRTLTKRTEYSTTVNTAAYRTQTQSVILAPRHAGLAYQSVSF
jgi:hypothetical protein